MTPGPLHAPLTDEHYQGINTALDAIKYARQHCDKCQSANLDMSHYHQLLDAQEQILTGIKRTFFPHRA